MNQSKSTSLGETGHLNVIFDQLDVSDDARRRLAQPMQTVQVNIPKDDGSSQLFQA